MSVLASRYFLLHRPSLALGGGRWTDVDWWGSTLKEQQERCCIAWMNTGAGSLAQVLLLDAPWTPNWVPNQTIALEVEPPLF